VLNAQFGRHKQKLRPLFVTPGSKDPPPQEAAQISPATDETRMEHGLKDKP
jgi:hypothetical protein